MPFLMVNLDDHEDCRRAIKQLRSTVGGDQPGGCDSPRGRGKRKQGRRGPRNEDNGPHEEHGPRRRGRGPRREDVSELTLPQKLKRIQQRKMWKHLVRIAKAGNEAQSLPELDAMLELPKNKMRSLKAIMAKLENRFGIKFLRVSHDAGVDGSGNPRYEMPKNIRRQILKLDSASDD